MLCDWESQKPHSYGKLAFSRHYDRERYHNLVRFVRKRNKIRISACKIWIKIFHYKKLIWWFYIWLFYFQAIFTHKVKRFFVFVIMKKWNLEFCLMAESLLDGKVMRLIIPWLWFICLSISGKLKRHQGRCTLSKNGGRLTSNDPNWNLFGVEFVWK